MDINYMVVLGIIIFSFVIISSTGIGLYFMFQRRKLIICRFLDRSGKWIPASFKKVDKTFFFQGSIYDFDIEHCTRDKINRPISSYYIGYPKQIVFKYGMGDKNIQVGTVELSAVDFRQIMLTKIIKDIFSDDNLQLWFIIMLITVIIAGAVNVFVTSSHNPQCVLGMDNSTILTIKEGVRQAVASAR